MPFTEEDYKYGSSFTSYTGSSIGCPPALGHGRFACCDGVYHDNYADVALLASQLMVEAMGEHRPEVDIIFRTASQHKQDCLNSMQLEAYLMQEYMPDGENHPLFKAVTQKSFKDFEAAIMAYKESK